jgi:glycosyltransferase involved in cell wall biosynthesis
MTDLVSILIPVYNREHIISETIKSALNQSYQHIEIIVVDNCSTDGTWEIINSFSSSDVRVKAFRNGTNIGPVRNWIRCAAEASGRYSKILWSDDLISRNYVEDCLKWFKDDVGFVYTGVKIFNIENKSEKLVNNELPIGFHDSNVFLAGALFGNNFPVSPGCAIFRSKDVKSFLSHNFITKVESDYLMHGIGPDLFLFLMSCHKYKRVAFVPDFLSYFRSHEGSISASANSVKLSVNYLRIRAYFVELYEPGLKSRFSAVLLFNCFKYDLRAYGIKSVGDFFFQKYSIDYRFFVKYTLRKLVIKTRKYLGRQG